MKQKKLRRYLTRLRKLLNTRPIARKDAGEDDKSRWVSVLSEVLEGMGHPSHCPIAVPHPTECAHVSDYLSAWQSESGTRNPLTGTHLGQVFLEDMADEGQRPPHIRPYLHVGIQRPAHVTAALEKSVCDSKSIPLHRLYSWWILVQNWRTLRFGDHRGLEGNCFSDRLTRYKTTGEDCQVAFRPVHIDACC